LTLARQRDLISAAEQSKRLFRALQPPLAAALLAFTSFNLRSKRQRIIIRSLDVAIVLESERPSRKLGWTRGA
jgi:hypothetical protein